MAIYLAFREIWHSRGRYLLISGVVALITTLVLFIAALGEGLGAGNREYLEKLDAELVAYQAKIDLNIAASRLGRSKLTQIRRVEGVAAVGQVGATTTGLIVPGQAEPLNISLVGVEPGAPGEPPVKEGRQLGRSRASEVIIERRIVERTGLRLGDTLVIKSIQGTQEELFSLEIVGVSDGRGLFLLPTIFVPYLTWDQVKPGTGNESSREFISNLIAVRLEDPAAWETMAQRIEEQVGDVEVVDRTTAYEATPGYTAQKSTLDTQQFFTFFIGILVVGGFFQIQTLQKVALIGMLKAVGISTATIALASITQIVAVNALGVAIGAIGSLLLSLTFPPSLPIIFTGQSLILTVSALLLIGPLGGIVSVFVLSRVEPLTALGLAQ